MKVARRLTSKLVSTVYRTYPLSDQVREAMKSNRKSQNLTTAAFLRESIQGHLPMITAELQEAGFAGGSETRPTRLPLDQELLAALKQAAEATGIPATRLLVACLARNQRRGKGPLIYREKGKYQHGANGSPPKEGLPGLFFGSGCPLTE